MIVSRINNTRSVSRIGTIVKVDSKSPDKFIYIDRDATSALGVCSQAVPYRAMAEIVTGGETKVFVVDNVRKGDTIRAQKSSDNISTGTCRVAKPTDAPYLKVGTALESGSGLIRCSLEWAYINTTSTGNFQPLDADLTRLADYRRIGGDTNYTQFSTDGFITLVGGAKGKLTMRPSLVAGRIGALTRPTPVEVGAHAGYSLPISTGSDDEELFYRDYIPDRWDGSSDFVASVICCLVATQTGGVAKYFKFQLSWENAPMGSAITAGTHDIAVNVPCAINETQYILHKVEFTVPWSTYAPNIAYGDHIGFRLRRITATGTAIADEVIVLDCIITYDVDKVFKAI